MNLKFITVSLLLHGLVLLVIADESTVQGNERHRIKTFHPIGQVARWVEAVQWCKLFNMKLATILSATENAQALAAIRQTGFKSPYFWIGGNEVEHHGSYTWVSNGHALSYTNWQPWPWELNSRGSAEHCIEMEPIHGNWHDDQCEHERMFVCEKDYYN